MSAYIYWGFSLVDAWLADVNEGDYKAYSIFIQELQDICHQSYIRHAKLDLNDALFLILRMYFICRKYAAHLIENQQWRTVLEG